jgi:hypothetical protein
MEFNNKDIKVNVSINLQEEVSDEIIKKYFNADEFHNYHEKDGKEWNYFVFNSDINRKSFKEFLCDFISLNKSFDIIVESDEEYIYEMFSYNSGNDFVTMSYLPTEYTVENREKLLLGIIFHLQEEKIKIDKLK